MGARLIEALKAHRTRQNVRRLGAGQEWKDMDLVFCNGKGEPVDGSHLLRRFSRILKRVGLRHVQIHPLRHTFASILIAAGHSVKSISSQMRHSSIKSTIDIYGHLMPEFTTVQQKGQRTSFLVTEWSRERKKRRLDKKVTH